MRSLARPRAKDRAAEMSQLCNIVVGMHQFAAGAASLVSELQTFKPYSQDD
jgi:hypothetical protein